MMCLRMRINPEFSGTLLVIFHLRTLIYSAESEFHLFSDL
jgi:hypothetical protein